MHVCENRIPQTMWGLILPWPGNHVWVGYLQRDFYVILQKYIRQAKCLSFFLGLILGYYEIRDRNSIFLVNNTAYHYYRWYLDRLSLLLLPVISGQTITITITGDIGTDYYYYYYYYRWYLDRLLLLLLLLPVISGQPITITITGDIWTDYYYYYYYYWWYRDSLLLLLLLLPVISGQTITITITITQKYMSLLLLTITITITISNSLIWLALNPHTFDVMIWLPLNPGSI